MTRPDYGSSRPATELAPPSTGPAPGAERPWLQHEGCDQRIAELEAAILDIDAHATPFGTDDDGFVTGGYLISVGCLHRALGLVGHTAPKCPTCEASTHDCAGGPT